MQVSVSLLVKYNPLVKKIVVLDLTTIDKYIFAFAFEF